MNDNGVSFFVFARPSHSSKLEKHSPLSRSPKPFNGRLPRHPPRQRGHAVQPGGAQSAARRAGECGRRERAAVLIASRALALPPRPLTPLLPPHTPHQIQNVVNDVATLAASDGGAVSVKLDVSRGFALDAPVAEFEAVVRGPAEVEETGRAMFSQDFGERREGGRVSEALARARFARSALFQPPDRPTHPPSPLPPADMDAYNELVTKAATTYKGIFV